MAGDWIKVRDNLHEDPAVAQISTALGVDIYGVIGRLIRIWTWADQQVEDGNASVTLVYLDALVNTPGMADAMVLARWLEVPENGRITFPKFDRHMSKSAKKRALTKSRVQLHRSNAPVTKKKRLSVTREEKSSSNKHLPVTKNKTPDKPAPATAKPPPIVAPSAPPPNGRSMAAHIAQAAGVKLRKPAFTDEIETLEPPSGAHPAPRPTPAANVPPPADWDSTPDGIDHAGQLLGMKRLPFEEDQDFANRIEARIALG